MKGGKLTCNRKDFDESGCLTLSCVDYDNKKFNSFNQSECNKPTGWVKYFDVKANSYYWYNYDTGEASWINPNNRGGKKKRSGKTKSKKYVKKNKTRKIKLKL